MASLEYGMYGYNTINPNGETSDMVFCSFRTFISGLAFTSGSAGIAAFSETTSDAYKMGVVNGYSTPDTYSAIRTPVSGIYEIEAFGNFVTSAASVLTTLTLLVDKACNFQSNGLFLQGSGGSYTAQAANDFAVTGQVTSPHIKTRIFLEKDSYLSLKIDSGTGTSTGSTNTGGAYFSVRLISAENGPKSSNQT